MNINAIRTVRRGFSLMEALVALMIVAFGLLALVGVSLKLARSEDVAKQRGEAARLAQQKIEELRSFTQIAVEAGKVSWDGLASGGDTLDATTGYTTNTSFARNWQFLGSSSDPMRTIQVSVSWNDRAGDGQTLSLASVISRTDPADAGSLGFPLPANTTLKRPKNRSLNIPVPAIDLGNGKSAVQLQGNLAVIFSNESGYVVQICEREVLTAADLDASCTVTNAYILAGYISLHGTSSFPAGIATNTALIAGTTGTNCSISNAVNQNTGVAIPGYKYYLCVISVSDSGVAWSGRLRLASPALNAGTEHYLVCRFQYPVAAGVTANQRNVQPYVAVADSLDSQNYVVTTSSSCPVISSLQTVEHQNCRSSGVNVVSVAQRSLNCPAG